MRCDGDGWALGPDGGRRWGRHGAAGLLLRAPLITGSPAVLLQHRAQWSHQGGTWALPGGARDSHESTRDAAVREAHEEAGIGSELIKVRSERVTSGASPGWSYTTVVADVDRPLLTTPNGESVELRWVAEDQVDHLPLHPGFAASWPYLRAQGIRLLLDTANVLGSRPDGWWRDRAAATATLLETLAAAVPRTIELPDGSYGWVSTVEAVLEGAAKTPWEHGAARRTAVASDARVLRHLASGSGDDEIVARLSEPGGRDLPLTAVVTADRGLRKRLPSHVLALSPSTVLGWLG